VINAGVIDDRAQQRAAGLSGKEKFTMIAAQCRRARHCPLSIC
jgi:hypothetical protein